jgi:DNA-binding transcriptional MocR family regulator
VRARGPRTVADEGRRPGLRVAALSARGPALARLRAARQAADLFVSPVLQEAALELVTDPGLAATSRAAARSARATSGRAPRRPASALPEVTVGRPAGGLQLWARLPDGLDDVAVSAAALRRWGPRQPRPALVPLPGGGAGVVPRLSFGCETRHCCARGSRGCARLWTT